MKNDINEELKIALMDQYARRLKDRLTNIERQISELGSIWSNLKTPSHQELINFCRESLLREGHDPVKMRFEYPIVVADKKYIADIAILDDKNKVHTVVECGNLSDPLKIQLFASLFPRFIWMPFPLIPDISKVRRFKQELMEILEQYREILPMIDNAIHYNHIQLTFKYVDLEPLEEILDEVRAIHDAKIVESKTG